MADFITEWTTTASPQSITLPLVNGGTYNFTVNYGDGSGDKTVTAYDDADATHEYATADTYTVTISGTISGWRFNNGGSKALITDVTQWGDLAFGNYDSTFYGCSNLDISATDAPTIGNTLASAFRNCSSLTSLDVSGWDVSQVTTFFYAFYGCSSLTSLDVSGWDTSKVTSFVYAFYGCSGLTSLDVSGWDTSKVTTFSAAFRGCSSLASLDVSGWDTSKVTTFAYAFYNCSSLSAATYNAALIGWLAHQPLQNGVALTNNAMKYSIGLPEKARQYLINRYGWSFGDGGLSTDPFGLTQMEKDAVANDPYQMFRRGNPVILGGAASSANNYTRTINDGMGVSDDKSLLAAVVRALSEAVGMADTASRAATMLRALTESLGIADSVIESTAAQLVETINDAVGLTDAQSRLSIMVWAMADSLGMADAATTLAVLLRTITDAQGITDGRTLARMVALADGLGVSDEMWRIVAYLRGRSDSVGLSDTMARLYAAVREITDAEGLTDSYSTAWTVLRTIADTLGLTDSMIQEGTGALVRVINDVLGIVDARTKLYVALRALASTINTADSMSRLFAVTRVISDAEGITDGAYLGKVFTFAESIGISDEVTRLVAFLRTHDDSVGVLEAILRVSSVIRSLDDGIEMTDVEQHSLSGLVQAALAFLFLKKGR